MIRSPLTHFFGHDRKRDRGHHDDDRKEYGLLPLTGPGASSLPLAGGGDSALSSSGAAAGAGAGSAPLRLYEMGREHKFAVMGACVIHESGVGKAASTHHSHLPNSRDPPAPRLPPDHGPARPLERLGRCRLFPSLLVTILLLHHLLLPEPTADAAALHRCTLLGGPHRGQ